MQPHKVCRICKASFPLSNFHKQAASKDGHQNRCKECAVALTLQWQRDNRAQTNKKAREWKKANPEKVRFMMHRDRLKRFYGMTVADYNTLLEAQGGICAICKQPSPNRTRLAVDHDHTTGKTRGLLCTLCNPALAQIERDPNWAKRAEFYLWSHSQRKVNTMATPTGKDMLYGADPQGEALEVAAAGLRNNCVLDINGGASDKSSAEKLSTDTADSRQDTEGKQDTENRGT